MANGFREAQTAVSALFIQREQNFSPAYPTPVLGKPWSVPMEFPLYQWTTVKLSDLTGLPLVAAGRLVALCCFYLSLPAFHLLLRRAGVAPWRSFIALGFVLSCPLYVFYGRAFLIETMALMFGAWFLLGLAETLERKSWRWFLLACAAGTAGALVKVTTLALFILLAGGWLLWSLRREFRDQPARRVHTLVTSAGWFLGALLPAIIATSWWVGHADAIKAVSPAGSFLTSSNLHGFNFGFGSRFTAETWRLHRDIWFSEIIPWPVLVAAVGAIFLVQRNRRLWGLMAAMLAAFLAVQTVFPLLYAYHAYYYLANAFLVMLALGLGLSGMPDRHMPAGVVLTILTGLHLAQAAHFWRQHGDAIGELKPGNIQFIEALKRSTGPEEVLLVAGDDWSSVIPYYSGRRALMIRSGLEDRRDFLDPALAALAGERVSALVLRDRQRGNDTLLNLAVERYGLAPEPAFQWFNTTVHLLPERRETLRAQLLAGDQLPQITLPDGQKDIVGRVIAVDNIPTRYQSIFAAITPRPFRCFSAFGLNLDDFEGRPSFSAHPTTMLWFRLPAGRHSFRADIAVLPAAYDEAVPYPDRSDGIDVVLIREPEDSTGEVIFSRRINPRDQPADRGPLVLETTFSLPEDTVVRLHIGPGPQNNLARDWTVLPKLELHRQE